MSMKSEPEGTGWMDLKLYAPAIVLSTHRTREFVDSPTVRNFENEWTCRGQCPGSEGTKKRKEKTTRPE